MQHAAGMTLRTLPPELKVNKIRFLILTTNLIDCFFLLLFRFSFEQPPDLTTYAELSILANQNAFAGSNLTNSVNDYSEINFHLLDPSNQMSAAVNSMLTLDSSLAYGPVNSQPMYTPRSNSIATATNTCPSLSFAQCNSYSSPFPTTSMYSTNVEHLSHIPNTSTITSNGNDSTLND